MDYGRLSMFMVVATAAMAIATHLWCWAYRKTAYSILKREWSRQDREEQEIEERRARAPRYHTYEQFQSDIRDLAVPLDEILDRLNGKFPPRAADLPKAQPSMASDSLSGVGLSAVLVTLAMVTCLYGSPSPKFVEALLQIAKDQFGKTPSSGGA